MFRFLTYEERCGKWVQNTVGEDQINVPRKNYTTNVLWSEYEILIPLTSRETI